MNIENIRKLLISGIVGKNLIYYETVKSTNSLLFELADNNLEDGSVLIADTQTGGKGRLGRSWFSPKGVNLYFQCFCGLK